MIRLEHVSKSYSVGMPALSDISLSIEPGEFVFITGDSGSGKSTLIKLLTKELDPTSGRILVNKMDLGMLKHKQVPRYRRNIGCVFQDFRLLNDRNVYDNVSFALRVVAASNRTIRQRVPQALGMVGLQSKYKSMPGQLSGGEQQRVAIARALVNNPKIILADEPTGNLDNSNAWDVMSILEDINAKGTTVVVVTHNMDFIRDMNKRVVKIQKGSIVYDSGKGGAGYGN